MKRCKPLLALMAIVFAIPSFGTHMRGGQISVRMTEPMKGKIKITAYLDTESPVPFGGSNSDILYIWGESGAPAAIQVPEIANWNVPPGATYTIVDPVTNLAIATYEFSYVFRDYGRYSLTYTEINRNAGILNMKWSVNTPLHLESFLSITPEYPIYNSPEFLASPIFAVATETGTSYSFGAYDVGDNVLNYRLRTPKAGKNADVQEYVFPSNMKLDPFSGLLTWDGTFGGESAWGELAIAVYVYQYRNGEMIGYIMRDLQLMAKEDYDLLSFTSNAEIDSHNSFHIESNDERSIKVIAKPEKPGNIILEVFSEWAMFHEGDFTFTTYDSTHGIKVGVINITNKESVVRQNPYQITVRAESYLWKKDLAFLVYTTETELDDRILNIEGNVQVNIFPNPVMDYLQIDTQVPLSFGKLYSCSGGTVDNLSFDNNRIDFRTVPTGMYVLNLVFRDGRTTKMKVIKGQ